MDESFDVCEKAHVEIYDLGFKEMAKVLNWKWINGWSEFGILFSNVNCISAYL